MIKALLNPMHDMGVLLKQNLCKLILCWLNNQPIVNQQSDEPTTNRVTTIDPFSTLACGCVIYIIYNDLTLLVNISLLGIALYLGMELSGMRKFNIMADVKPT